uniref:G_PROTEIN_RECEP_F1_2 domain-containing protein n=1 Tax=Globodera pallida TaxID=36090 RepID=A0A183CN46_GLOPA
MLFLISLAEQSSTDFAIGTSVSRLSSPQFTTHSASVAGGAANGATAANQQPSNKVCLGFADIFIAFILILLILATVLGNILVVLSVFLYKRMRTFTNFLLTSLATADLLVGLLIMPLALFDLLHNHNWPLGKALCRIWATFDVLLCTASILNLCIISLDRYMAITSPLRYPRTRQKQIKKTFFIFKTF